MIDKAGRGIIIDFGSVLSFLPIKKPIIEDDGIIRSTPGYFIPFGKAKKIHYKL